MPTSEPVPFLGWWITETVSDLVPDPKSTWIAERGESCFCVTARCAPMVAARSDRLELARVTALGSIRARIFLDRWTPESEYAIRVPVEPRPVTDSFTVRLEVLKALRTVAEHALPRGSYYIDLPGVAAELGISHEALVFELEYLLDKRFIDDPQTNTSNVRTGCMWITSGGIDYLSNQLPATAQVLQAVVFTDIVESTALTVKLGDAAYLEASRPVLDAVRNAVAGNGGECMKGRALGDGVLAVFPSTRPAIECALESADGAARLGLPIRAGVHVGDVVREQDDVTGGTVNLAARIATAAEPGQVLVSSTAKDACYTSTDVVFTPRPKPRMKGIAHPPNVFVATRRTHQEPNRDA